MRKLNRKTFFQGIIIVVLALYAGGCMRYLTHDRSKVLLKGVDIDQSLKVAEIYMTHKNGGMGAALAIWAIRDQYFTPVQAEKVSELYFKHITTLKKGFDIWHLTWAISDSYRLGNDDVKAAIQNAYNDATQRAKKQGGLAEKMANGDTFYMGDAHSGGRAFAKKHVVVPGNKKYVQSVDEYIARNKKQTKNSK